MHPRPRIVFGLVAAALLATACTSPAPRPAPAPPGEARGPAPATASAASAASGAAAHAAPGAHAVPTCGATITAPDAFRAVDTRGDLEHLRLAGPDGVVVAVSCLPKRQTGPTRVDQHAVWVLDERTKGIADDRVGVTRAREIADIDGAPVLAADLQIAGEASRSRLAFFERPQILYWIEYSAPAATWDARAKERVDLLRSFHVTDPAMDRAPTRWWHPAMTEEARSLSDARAAFRTNVKGGRPAAFDGKPAPTPPRGTFTKVSVPGPAGRLTTYVTPNPRDGKKHPAVVWAHGGFGGIDGDFWKAAPSRANDQTARAFREAGIVLAVGSWRAENDNPGDYELYYGEVDDYLAIRDWVAKLPYVDPARIYLAGHSSGGTLVLLAAEKSDRFRAAFSIGGIPLFERSDTYDRYGGVPFDAANDTERLLRSPGPFVRSIRRPTFYFEGAGSASGGAAQWMADRARAGGVPFDAFLAMDANHFTILAPLTELIARKIVADTGPTPNVAFTQQEIDALEFAEE